MGDAGGVGLIFLGIAGFLGIVDLGGLRDGVAGDESTLWMNFTSINSRIVSIDPPGFPSAVDWITVLGCGSR